METDAEQLLLGFEDILGKSVNVFGGMAGDDYTFQNNLFSPMPDSNRGIVAIALDEDKIKLKVGQPAGGDPLALKKLSPKVKVTMFLPSMAYLCWI